jgi:hypothetical protein
MGSRTEVLSGLAIVAVCVAAGVLSVVGGTSALLGIGAIAALLVSVYVGIRHPLWLYWGLAAMVGALPFGYFPGVHVPLYLPFAAGAITAAIVHESNGVPFHRLEKAVIVLAVSSGVAMIFTARSVLDVTVYIRWLIATMVLIALLRLSRDNLAKFGRIYVYAATLNALFGIAIVAADPNHRFIKILSIFEYDREDTGRYVFTDEGQSRFARLGGTWVDPNIAGIGLIPALVLALVLLKGKLRVLATAILSMAVVLTLSRAAIVSVLAGIILVAFLHSMRNRNRVLLMGSLSLAAAGALMVPAVRTRMLSSFGSDDTGAQDRGRALAEFPNVMSGHWLFGLGWGRQEWIDGAFAFRLNFVSNSPLITIYRSGMIVGLVFLAVLVIACVMSYRALRSESLPAAIYGGVFIGFCVVALQLDHPVVTSPQSGIAFGIFLAFLVYLDRSRPRPSDAATPRTDATGTRTTPTRELAARPHQVGQPT